MSNKTWMYLGHMQCASVEEFFANKSRKQAYTVQVAIMKIFLSYRKHWAF